jgi:excisionase family DNA binding protein
MSSKRIVEFRLSGQQIKTVRKLLTVAEVSEELRVTRGTAYRWIREGSLPAVRVGGTVRIPSKLLVDRLARSMK